MKIKDFAVERYFAKYEFTAKYLLSSSDCDGYSMEYVLNLASNEDKNRWNSLKLGYTETRGSEELRTAIAQHFQTIGTKDVVVSSPGEANFSLMNVLLKRGDHVVCMAPMYQSMYQIAKNMGCRLSFWQPDFRDDWYYDPAQLERLITPKTKLVIVNFPHNPTGYSPNLADWQAIIDIVRKHGVTLFSDEMYRFLNHKPEDDMPSACDMYENAVSLWGTAKTFGLGGVRLGWLTTKNQTILQKVEAFKDYLSICSSAPSEILATIALNNLSKFVDPNVAKIKQNIAVFKAFQEKNAEIMDFYCPKSGSTAFIKLNLKETSLAFAERVVEDTGIMLLPAETFEYGTKHVRIGFGRDNMPEILGVLGDYLKK